MKTADLEDWKTRVVGFGSDGASVMIGCENGLSTKLRRDQGINWLVNVHCLAHGLELAAQDALKEHPIMKSFSELLRGMYKQYHKSPKVQTVIL